ncbi:MAG: type II toxin-antitoxin system RelE/ParE family toxin [Verrucomicrobiota bacterium]
MRIRIVGSAARDLDEGFQFYESQDRGLGDYFLSSMKADIESLRITGGVHGVAYRDYHRLLCKTFPFAVYYTKSGREITIYAVVDCRRDPAWIRGHLEQSQRTTRSTE